MTRKPTYEELQERVKTLEKEIADHTATEVALRESEEQCRLTFEKAVDAIFWADPETGLITNCNEAAEKLLDRSRNEIVGQHQTMLHPPDKAEYYADMFKRHIEKNGSLDEEGEIITESGQIIPVRITASVTFVRAKPIIQGIFRDITERRRVEEELREGEEKYSTLVESSLTGIYIDQDDRIVFANNTFAEIYGYPKHELLGLETWKLVHPEDRALTDNMRARRLKGEDVPAEYEARGLKKSGETIWVRRRNTRIEYRGKPAILGNVADITEQKGVEEELRRINAELENFVHVVSHDLKTPIISIQGFASRLLTKYGDTMEDKERNYLEQIRMSADRMELLVSDLLSLSRAGRVVSTFEEVSSLEIVRSVVSSLRDRLDKDHIELVIEENLPTIYCDRDRIYQVFENLLNNALKFLQDTQSPEIEIGCEENGAFHRFYVKDNGMGIDPKYHGKIFEMFHRLKEAKDQEGSGLGLAIVKRIIDHHGGEVWVESERTKGATFYFTLPKEP
jgi:PAS domain S-box-containing protein